MRFSLKRYNFWPINMQSGGQQWGQNMEASIKRRLSVASCWATSRIAVLDVLERYEDSYAITQEFREWITCSGDHPEHLKDSILKVPFGSHKQELEEKTNDLDEALEI